MNAFSKFRIWDKKQKIYLAPHGLHLNVWELVKGNFPVSLQTLQLNQHLYIVEPNIGLLDSNNTDIYLNDVLQVSFASDEHGVVDTDYTGVVEWDDGWACFLIRTPHVVLGFDELSGASKKKVVVISQHHDNV